MSVLVSLDKVCLAYGSDALLDKVDFQIEPGERVCLIGRNGAGKSSFLRMIEGVIQPDSGKVHRSSHLRIARLEQELPQSSDLTVYDAVAQGLAKTGEILTEYHHLVQTAFTTGGETEQNRLFELQQQIDACQGWQLGQYIDEILTRLDLPADKKVAELSGGWQRRVALARALVHKPELLLLDEPTNHLDIEAIQWLEEQLLSFNGGILFITHDRSFLCRLATRIIELDRGNLISWPGSYDNFLRRKEELYAAEAHLNREFDKKLAEEEKWIRQGIKARRTRNEGRVRALEDLRKTRSERRDVQGTVNLELNRASISGQLVAAAENITYGYDDKIIINDFSTRIIRGDRIGLLGPNGIGKTTLLHLLLGKLVPQKGKIQLGTKLEVAYFDQLRAALDPEKTILENVAGGRTSIMINGKERHAVSYLNDFLFPSHRLHTPVKALSGGECNRLLLAQLFSLPANILVMDEPTNDLDIETLELLEELLSQFTGTLLLVSHDRTFLDNIVTSTMVFEGNGKVSEYVGGYQDWLRQAPKIAPVASTKSSQSSSSKSNTQNTASLNSKEQKEFAALPNKIEQLEKQQVECLAKMGESGFYEQSPKDIQRVTDKLQKIEQDIAEAYARWEVLEQQK